MYKLIDGGQGGHTVKPGRRDNVEPHRGIFATIHCGAQTAFSQMPEGHLFRDGHESKMAMTQLVQQVEGLTERCLAVGIKPAQRPVFVQDATMRNEGKVSLEQIVDPLVLFAYSQQHHAICAARLHDMSQHRQFGLLRLSSGEEQVHSVFYQTFAQTSHELPNIGVHEIRSANWQYQADEAATTAPVLEPPKGLDTSFLAEKLLGYAAVVHLSGAAADGFPQKVPAEFRVDAGGVRVYQPAMDEWRSESAERHPRFPEESLRYWSVAATDGSIHTGPSAFAEYLVRVLRSGMAQRTVDWRGVLRFPEVFDAFLAERQDNVGPEDCRDCRGNYETRINALREEIERLQSENEYFVDEAGHAESEAAVLRQDRFLLEERVTRLTEELEGKLVPEGAGDAAEPARLDLVPDWARARFGRRLILLPRAVRELKSADFEDVTLLCDALRLLATDYYDMHVGKLRVAEFTDRARALGLTWGPSIDETQAGRHGEAYFVQYPLQQGRGRRTFLQQHLRKGTSFESRHCLRIYFFWGEEDQKVVIGSLPRHLPSSAE